MLNILKRFISNKTIGELKPILKILLIYLFFVIITLPIQINFVFSQIALSDKTKNNLEQSIKIRKQLLKFNQTFLGNNNYYTIKSIEDLASDYLFYGNLNKAKSLFIQAIDLRSNNKTDNTYQFICDLTDLGYISEQQGQYNKAEDYCKKTLYLNSKIEGENSNSYLASLLNLQSLYIKTSNYSKANQMYKTLTKYKCDVDNPFYFVFVHLKVLYYLQFLHEDKSAENIIKTSINKAQNIKFEYYYRGKEILYIDLAKIYISQMKFEEALKIYQIILEQRVKDLGSNNKFSNNIYFAQGYLYKKIKRKYESTNSFKKVIHSSNKSLNEGHPNIICAYFYLGENQEDNSFIHKAITLRKKTINEYYPNYSGSINDIKLFCNTVIGDIK